MLILIFLMCLPNGWGEVLVILRRLCHSAAHVFFQSVFLSYELRGCCNVTNDLLDYLDSLIPSTAGGEKRTWGGDPTHPFLVATLGEKPFSIPLSDSQFHWLLDGEHSQIYTHAQEATF